MDPRWGSVPWGILVLSSQTALPWNHHWLVLGPDLNPGYRAQNGCSQVIRYLVCVFQFGADLELICMEGRAGREQEDESGISLPLQQASSLGLTWTQVRHQPPLQTCPSKISETQAHRQMWRRLSREYFRTTTTKHVSRSVHITFSCPGNLVLKGVLVGRCQQGTQHPCQGDTSCALGPLPRGRAMPPSGAGTGIIWRPPGEAGKDPDFP